MSRSSCIGKNILFKVVLMCFTVWVWNLLHIESKVTFALHSDTHMNSVPGGCSLIYRTTPLSGGFHLVHILSRFLAPLGVTGWYLMMAREWVVCCGTRLTPTVPLEVRIWTQFGQSPNKFNSRRWWIQMKNQMYVFLVFFFDIFFMIFS